MPFWWRCSTLTGRFGKITPALALIALVVSACGDADSRHYQVAARAADVEVSAVYATLINDLYGKDIPPLIIAAQTSVNKFNGAELEKILHQLSEKIPGGIPKELLDDFLRKNTQHDILTKHLKLKVEYRLLSTEEISKLIPEGDWMPFLTKYPRKGLITLSQVGFNQKMDQALVYTGHESGGKSGAGFIVIIIKEKQNWVVRHNINIWVS